MTRRRLVILILLAGVVAAAALVWRRSPPGITRLAGLNVLLITIDTLRDDAVGPARGVTATPWLDRLAATGVRFTNAHAHNVLTLPSHANILSGRLPQDHGVRDNAGFRVPATVETIATLLKAQGYRTGAFVSAFPVAARFGLARGFDTYEDRFVDAVPRPAIFEQERPGARTVSLAIRWLAEQGGEPWFCWIHLYEPHYPYEPPEPFRSRFPDRPYLGEVASADAELEPVLAPVLTSGSGSRTLVLVTSDHGESLGEHDESTHGIFAYESTLEVPLILHQPTLLTPAVITAPARHIDLLPTVMDALALPAPPSLPGRSLLAAASGQAEDDVITYFEAFSGSLNRGWAPLRGLIQRNRKYIDLPIPELYDLDADPREAHNLADQANRVEPLRLLLAPLISSDRGVHRGREDDDTRARLRSLGYVATDRAPRRDRYTESDDPKRLMTLDRELQAVVSLYAAGNLPSALARCRELVRQRPDMPISLLHLGFLEHEAGNLPAAVDALRRALAMNPRDPQIASLLGAYLTEAGKPADAASVLEPQASDPDPDVQVVATRALALARMGKTSDALASLETLRLQHPNDVMIRVHQGTIALMGRTPDVARTHFEAALALNPDVARAHSSLGVIAAEAGRVTEAEAHWRRACQLDAHEYGRLLAIGVTLARGGRARDARPYLQFFASNAPPAQYAADLERVRVWLRAQR